MCTRHGAKHSLSDISLNPMALWGMCCYYPHHTGNSSGHWSVTLCPGSWSRRYKDQALSSNYNPVHSIPGLECHSSFLFLILSDNTFARKVKKKKTIKAFKHVETCTTPQTQALISEFNSFLSFYSDSLYWFSNWSWPFWGFVPCSH